MRRVDITSSRQLSKNRQHLMLTGSVDECVAKFTRRYPWMADTTTVYVMPPIKGDEVYRCYFPMDFKPEEK